MKHTFLTFITLLSFTVVSVVVPLHARAVDTGAGSKASFDIENSLSGMSSEQDIAAIALTCLAGPVIADTVVGAVSSVTGGISNLFSPEGITAASDGANVVADVEVTAETTATAAATAAETAATVETGAAAASAVVVPTSNPVLQAAHAAQLVNDAAQTTLITASTAAQLPKEQQAKMDNGIMDCIVYDAGQKMLTQLTNNTVSWIQGGFHGSPSFTINTHEVFLDLADMVAGDLARELRGIAMCNFSVNFKNDLSNIVELSGKKNYRFAAKTKCPFPETLNLNSSDFYKGVNQFSWGSMEYAMQESGNPFGVALLTGEELARRSSEKEDVRKQELAWSSGFTNIVDTDNCHYPLGPHGYQTFTGLNSENTTITQYEWDDAVKEGRVTTAQVREYQKTYCKTTTPGKMLGDKLTEATGVDMQRLGMIDNINKIVGVLISQVTKQAATGIFCAVGGDPDEPGCGNNPLPTDYVTVQERSAQTIDMENAAVKPYYDAWQAEVQKEEDAQTELARLIDQRSHTIDIDTVATLNAQIEAQQAIIAAAPDKIATAKVAYDDAGSAERSIDRQKELVDALTEYDAARIVLQTAELDLANAQREYNNYLSGSIAGGTYIPPDAVTLESYKQDVKYADDAYREAKINFDSASNRRYVAEHPAYVAPL